MSKKNVISILIYNFLSIIYTFTQNNKLLGFANAISLLAILCILISGFTLLENFGYFDVFGYTFKKTYLVLTKKYGNLETNEKKQFASMYDYSVSKKIHRKAPSWQIYIFSLIILIEGIILNIIYIYS